MRLTLVMARIQDLRSKGEGEPYWNSRQLYFATPEYADANVSVPVAHGVLDTLWSLSLDLAGDLMQSDWEPSQATTFVLTGYAPLVPQSAYPLPARSGRRQTEKHLQLAAFTAQKEAEGLPLADRLAEWNQRYPRWAYRNTTNFGWDSRQAERRLIPQIGPAGDEEIGEAPALQEDGSAIGEQEENGGAIMVGDDRWLIAKAQEQMRRREQRWQRRAAASDTEEGNSQ